MLELTNIIVIIIFFYFIVWHLLRLQKFAADTL